MIIGQFSSRGSIKVFDFSPVLRGMFVVKNIIILSIQSVMEKFDTLYETLTTKQKHRMQILFNIYIVINLHFNYIEAYSYVEIRCSKLIFISISTFLFVSFDVHLGIGYGQVISTGIVTTYYASLMALTIRYIFFSFSETLPWTYCKPEWTEPCIDSKLTNYFPNISSNSTKISTSAELFFL